MSRIAGRILPALLLLAGLHQAAADTRIITGGELVLNASSSEDVIIDTDASLHGQIRLSMIPGLSCVTVTGGSPAIVSNARCDDSGHLHVTIAPDAPLTISSSGNGDIHLADLRGPLIASVSGSGDLTAGRTGPITLSVHASGDATLGDVNGPAIVDINGSGNVHMRAVHGQLTVRQTGSGDLVSGGIQAADVILEGNGSGDVLLGAGHIEHLQARMNGSGDLSVAASLRDANVAIGGGGDAKLGPVSGTLNQTASDDSSVVVLDAVHARAIDDQVARKLGLRGGGSMHVGAQTATDLENFLTFAFVVLVLFICWRIVRRAGGLPGLGRQWRGGTVAAPSNPAVLALGETMTRLEQRLGRLESYVTTREFDLARKFREMGP